MTNRVMLNDGTIYPSQAAASRALGLSRNAVFQALGRGTLDNIGKLERKIEFEGKVWATHRELAAHLGVNVSTLSYRKAHGIPLGSPLQRRAKA